jgi:lipoate---protein ligase
MGLALLDLTLPSLAENLALDEALLLEAESGSGGEVLRFWEWPSPAIVLGAGGKLETDVDEQTCRRDAVPVHRRASGGGTVLLGRGCLLFTLILRFEREITLKDVNASYRYILSRMKRALEPLVVAEHLGISDLAAAGQKFSGNAQQRKRDHLLHHGTFLYDFDHSSLSRWLRPPIKQPAYREDRTHELFLTNLPANTGRLKQLVIDEWKPESQLGVIPLDRIAELVAEKYGRLEWVSRR